METVPTMQIDVNGSPVTINVSDFDATTMKVWEETKASEPVSPRVEASETSMAPETSHESGESPRSNTTRRPR